MTISRATISPDGWRLAATAGPAVACAALLGYALTSGGYLASVLGFALIYAVFVTGLNVFMGHAGQVTFGQNAFAAIGGYASAWLGTALDWEPLAGLAVGVSLALGLALLIGYPILRLKGHYLAMGTLAVGLIVQETAVQWEAVTGGYSGIAGIPPLGIGPFQASTDNEKLVVVACVTALGLLVAHLIRRSRLGRAMAAVAGSEDAARALGIDVARCKLTAFLVAATYAAVSGWLFVHVVGYVSPEVFGLHMVNVAFTMLYVGGLGTTFGPLLGAVIISLLPETFRVFKDYQDLVYGAMLIVILIHAPRGLASIGTLLRARSRAQP